MPLVQNHYFDVSAGSSDERLTNENLHASADCSDGGNMGGGGDVVDEKTSLLKAEEGTYLNPASGSESAQQPLTLNQKPSPIDLVRINTMGRFSFQNLENGK